MVKHSRLEMSINNMPQGSEVVALLPKEGGLCRVAVDDKPVTPPLCFLELPVKKGKRWKVSSQVGKDRIEGELVANEVERTAKEMNIPYFANKGGEKLKLLEVTGNNLVVKGDNKKANEKENNQPLKLTYYFAPDVGIVKQVVDFAGVKAELSLKSYDFNK